MSSNYERMIQFDNMTFEDGELSENEDNVIVEIPMEVDSLPEMLKAEKLLDEIMQDSSVRNLDLSSLNATRVKSLDTHTDFQIDDPGSSRRPIKMGSLEPSIPIDDNEAQNDLFREVTIALDENADMDEKNRNLTATKALLNYFSMLGQPTMTDDFDYQFVDTLCQKADINLQDKYGQTLMHEIAREWNSDTAYFLKTRGCKIDVSDWFGRTPLFVSIASNNTEMIEWLIENGADINHRTTKGEEQCPVHYAGKYDSIEAFDILVKNGADPIIRDVHDRTPFFVAAEAGNSRICSHFLDLEFPTVSYSDSGVSTLDEIIKNLTTDLALRALNQFTTVSINNPDNVNIYLSCLGKKRWRLLAQKKSKVTDLPTFMPPSPLELITQKEDLSLISHPVILQYIKVKSKLFGDKFTYINLAFNIIFTILWTLASTIRVGEIDDPQERPSEQNKILVIVITVVAQLLTFIMIYKLYRKWSTSRDFVKDEKRRQKKIRRFNKQFCHPRWVGDMTILKKKKEASKRMRHSFWRDGWNIIEVICLLLACVNTLITVMWYIAEEATADTDNNFDKRARIYFCAFFVLILWIRLNRTFKSFESFGSFVDMLGECVIASAQIGFLFAEFFIPFVVAVWVLFGDVQVAGGTSDYMKLSDTMYQLWLMTIIGDYEFNTLLLIHHGAAQVIVGIYFLSVSIITINLYIALLSEAFSRVNGNASFRAYMEKARFISLVERMFPEVKRRSEIYLNMCCAPMAVDKKEFLNDCQETHSRTVVSNVEKTIHRLNKSMQKIVQEAIVLRKDVGAVEEEHREFHRKYAKKKTSEMVEKFTSSVVPESKSLAAVGKLASEYIGRLADKVEVF